MEFRHARVLSFSSCPGKFYLLGAFFVSSIMLDSYRDYLALERRLSPATVTAYVKDVAQWTAFLEWEIGITDAQEATRSHVRSWVAHLVDCGVEHRSVNRKLSTLRSFYRFLEQVTGVSHHPAVGIPALKEKKRLVRALRREEMDVLLDPAMYTDAEHPERDRFLILTLYAFGLRRAELIGLKHGDVSLSDGTLRVLGKRNKERILPILPIWAEAYQNFCLLEGQGLDGPIFLNHGSESMPPRLVYSIVHAYLQRASNSESKSPHVLRHTFATHLLDMGADLSAIRSLLGHANLSATQIYTHASMEQLKRVYHQSHPKGR